jgi:hypothetical protein
LTPNTKGHEAKIAQLEKALAERDTRIEQLMKALFGRLNYKQTIEALSVASRESAWERLRTVPIVTTYYLFSPLPWQVSTVRDLFGFGESCLRIYLFVLALKGIRTSRGETRKMRSFLFLYFLMMEALWASGTANIGTAVRHRVVAWGGLVLAGGGGMVSSESNQPEMVTAHRILRAQIRERRRKSKLEESAPVESES